MGAGGTFRGMTKLRLYLKIKKFGKGKSIFSGGKIERLQKKSSSKNFGI